MISSFIAAIATFYFSFLNKMPLLCMLMLKCLTTGNAKSKSALQPSLGFCDIQMIPPIAGDTINTSRDDG